MYKVVTDLEREKLALARELLSPEHLVGMEDLVGIEHFRAFSKIDPSSTSQAPSRAFSLLSGWCRTRRGGATNLIRLEPVYERCYRSIPGAFRIYDDGSASNYNGRRNMYSVGSLERHLPSIEKVQKEFPDFNPKLVATLVHVSSTIVKIANGQDVFGLTKRPA